ncbi:hypothetical protein [Azospirillum himalayense]|uniref:Uncharacterized protein n=1 Tax=Azospirillum himalayense TaxID=654847 RepID=A0ABW0FY59_9PROT
MAVISALTLRPGLPLFSALALRANDAPNDFLRAVAESQDETSFTVDDR